MPAIVAVFLAAITAPVWGGAFAALLGAIFYFLVNHFVITMVIGCAIFLLFALA